MINLRKKKFIICLGLLGLFALVLAGCAGVENSEVNKDDGTLTPPTQEEPLPNGQMEEGPAPDANTEQNMKDEQNNQISDQPASESIPDQPAEEKPLPQDDMNSEF